MVRHLLPLVAAAVVGCGGFSHRVEQRAGEAPVHVVGCPYGSTTRGHSSDTCQQRAEKYAETEICKTSFVDVVERHKWDIWVRCPVDSEQ